MLRMGSISPMKSALLPLALFSAALLASCSSAREEEAAPAPTDRVVVRASTATQEAIGVFSWGLREDGSAITVRGYDAKNEPLVTFGYRAARGSATTFDAMLDVGTRRSKLRLEAPKGAGVQVIENSLGGDPAARDVLARMVADLRSQNARASEPAPSLASRSPLRPLAENGDDPLAGGDSVSLVGDQCVYIIPRTTADAAETTSNCSTSASSPECQKGVDQAPTGQDQAKQCNDAVCDDSVYLAGGGMPAVRKEAITGVGTSSIAFDVNGTDLGIPFLIGKSDVGFLFGDTFSTPLPPAPGVDGHWRSPVMLHSASRPSDGIVLTGSGAQIMDSAKSGCNGEFTIIPNDGVTLKDGRQVVSYMSIKNWKGVCPEDYPGLWRTNYAGMAVSVAGGGSFARAPIRFGNDDANQDAFQMQTMQLDGDYVYVYGVRAGRQHGPMMLQRVRSEAILERGAYECWNGEGWGGACVSVLRGAGGGPDGEFEMGEPSVRKLDDCTWAMAYLESGRIVTRSASRPEGPWSGVHEQVSFAEQPCLYGGFIHPMSTAQDLHLMVSTWGDAGSCGGASGRYAVDHFVGTL